ncbi:MAG TPA: hypothetical protein VHQ89_02935 [Gaiellaceae bacterium]|nr:hypothetical protein [Gaiellaceae bacterium]
MSTLGRQSAFELVEQELHAKSELVVPAHHATPYVIRDESDLPARGKEA